jgi:hypothetical protein
VYKKQTGKNVYHIMRKLCRYFSNGWGKSGYRFCGFYLTRYLPDPWHEIPAGKNRRREGLNTSAGFT